MSSKYHFSGWATRNDVLCTDGRTIRKNAFKDDDGKIVPLVWNHQYDTPDNVIGHALLKNCDEGVRAFCVFNDTENGKIARKQVEHGDITNMSICAHQLKQKLNDVIHGCIKEVSLVVAGANPGAVIDSVTMSHGEYSDEEAIIYTDEALMICHVDNQKESDNTEKKTDEDVSKEKSEDDNLKDKPTMEEIFESMTEEQQNLLLGMVGEALVNKKENEEYDEKKDDEEDELEGGKTMKHNAFDKESTTEDKVLTHSDIQNVIKDIKRYGSLKESMVANEITVEQVANTLKHADYGVEHIDYLFPDAKNVTLEPTYIARNMAWVDYVMKHVHRTPFSRIKSIHANITEDEARARGYIKGKLKKEEVFTLLKRVTSPTTVYKKQKVDRDDIVDITDFDMLVWMKNEMRVMLNEELARAYLVGDGRSSADNDKIKEDCVRPIWKDEDLFTIKKEIAATKDSTDAERAKAFITGVIKSRKEYKGSGSPALFATEDIITECLLLEDSIGRTIYESEEKLKRTLHVSDIVTVPVMDGLERKDTEGNTFELLGLLVNLNDYNVGADKQGEVNTFEQFDIDYNQQKYLMETRSSGAMIKPYAAIAYEIKTPRTDG